MFEDKGKFYVDYFGQRHEFHSRWFAEQCVHELRAMAEEKAVGPEVRGGER